VRTAPVLRGGPVLTGVWLVVGLFLFACGIVCFLQSRLGLPPWDVLHQGIAKHTPLPFGVANEVVGVIVLFVAWGLGSRPGIGTFANAILIGAFVVVLQPLHAAHALGDASTAGRVGVLGLGLVLFGVGSALYIGAGVGAGPRDSLMLVGSKRTGVRVGAMRAAIESSVLVVGFLLGGKVGVGTVLFALLIGPCVEAAFLIAARSRLAALPRAGYDRAADSPG
jgi:uncharacterized membrane protein YczE